MKRIALGIALSIVIAGCGESSAIKAVVKDQLNDPGSANFKDEVISKSGEIACIPWNAKNKMGGYGEWHYALLVKDEKSSWVPERMDIDSSACTKDGIEAYSARKAARSEALVEAITLLAEKGRAGSACVSAAKEYQYHAGELALDEGMGREGKYHKEKKEALKKKLGEGEC